MNTIDDRYRRLFTSLSGHLPRNRGDLDAWLASFGARLRAERGRTQPSPAVQELALFLERDAVARMYVTQMIQQAAPQLAASGLPVSSVEDLLAALTVITRTAPTYNTAHTGFFPMSSLFVYMMMTTAGEAAFRYPLFNKHLADILGEWCAYLDGGDSKSVLNDGPEGWLSPQAVIDYDLKDFVTDPSDPHWGFTSFNDFFHRQIKRSVRPIAGPDDPTVVTSANDGTKYRFANSVNAYDQFWIKGQPYSMLDMLDHDEYAERFISGAVIQSFLSGADYHRWWAPVSGIVRRARVVKGLMFSDAESAGEDPTAGTYSQAYGASVNTRGLIFIEGYDGIGMVCVMPIGITEISSVKINVTEGSEVAKGDELGYFSYGGSSMVLAFEPGVISVVPGPYPPDPDHIPEKDKHRYAIQAGSMIARANKR